MTLQVWSRIQTARGVGDGDFTLKGHESIDTDLSPREFLRLCLQESFTFRILSPEAVVPLSYAGKG